MTLILDFGNVVGFFDHRQACRRLASLGTRGATPEQVYADIFGTRLESDYDCGRLTTTDFLSAVREILGSGASDAALAEAWSNIFRPNDDVVAVLPAAKRGTSSIVLASNTNELHFRQIESQFATALAWIDEKVLSFQIGAQKPAPVFFERCLAVSGTSAAKCVYVDDRSSFVDAARALGMTGVVYGPQTRLASALADVGLQLFWSMARDAKAATT